MKKLLYIFLAGLAAVAISCTGKDDPDNGGKNKPEQPDPEPEAEYEPAVKIDGNFDDWAKLDASKVTTVNCAADAKFKALKSLKVYSDEFYVFFCFEYDDALIPDKSDVQCHFYFDADNNTATGGYANQFTSAGFEYMCEGHIFLTDKICSFDPSISEWIGETGASGWDWETIYPSGSGVFSGNGGSGKYEVSLMRDSFSELGDEFLFGMDIQQAWSSVGILPNANMAEDNTEGKGAPMYVKVSK